MSAGPLAGTGMEPDWLVPGGQGGGKGDRCNEGKRFDRMKGKPAITAKQAM